MSVYETCTESYDLETDLSGLLECISSGGEAALDDAQLGMDYFFLVITVSEYPLVNGRPLHRFESFLRYLTFNFLSTEH